jgi:hypothetical protein
MLNWQRPLWEGNQEVAKRSGRNKSMEFAIHKCMETMLGISLYSYLHLKLVKMICLSYYLLCFLFNRIREQEAEPVPVCVHLPICVHCIHFCTQTMYTHVSKCNNDKIKGERKKTKKI